MLRQTERSILPGTGALRGAESLILAELIGVPGGRESDHTEIRDGRRGLATQGNQGPWDALYMLHI
jgi:hypothetical protein